MRKNIKTFEIVMCPQGRKFSHVCALNILSPVFVLFMLLFYIYIYILPHIFSFLFLLRVELNLYYIIQMCVFISYCWLWCRMLSHFSENKMKRF